jgi:hypothetical protein
MERVEGIANKTKGRKYEWQRMMGKNKKTRIMKDSNKNAYINVNNVSRM